MEFSIIQSLLMTFLNIVRREKNMPEQKEIFSFNEFKEKEYDKWQSF